MIDRYTVETADNYDMERRPDGLWVFYDDVAQLLKDAERYRWLRTAGAWQSEVQMQILSESPAQFDSAVDSEIEAENSGR